MQSCKSWCGNRYIETIEDMDLVTCHFSQNHSFFPIKTILTLSGFHNIFYP